MSWSARVCVKVGYRWRIAIAIKMLAGDERMQQDQWYIEEFASSIKV
jgi:hypothetical protein